MLEQGQYQSDDEQADSQQTVKTEDKLARNQKIAVAVLVVFGLFTFIFWASQLNNSIKGPFVDYQDNSNNTGNVDSADNNTDLTKDTDKDGLTDVEELNIYKTSPYIADSDSDSILDGKEVADGTDPNCPVGRDCFGSATSTDITSADSQDVTKSVISSSSLVIPETNNTGTSSALNGLMSGNVSATDLRQMLQQSGMDKATLDGISDDLLMSTFKDTLKNQK